METDDELLDRLRRALADNSRPEPRPADVARVRALAAAGEEELTLSGAQVHTFDTGDAAPSAGVVEFDQSIAALGSGTVNVEGRLAGIGRIVNLSSSDLPILPKGEFYEVWFVGVGDTPGSQNRISAGTFHPDPEGKTKVALTAAVDPSLYPTLVITAEPGDGNPGPSDTEILRGQLTIIG